MLIDGLILLFLLYKKRLFNLLRNPILIAIAVYAALHLIMLAFFHQSLTNGLAGLAIDLRYLLYFALVYLALQLYPQYRKSFIYVGIAGALVVTIFALLQVYILPYDFLKYLGYSKDTIVPYLYIDKNSAFVRINSTLRGPNPLGAYATVVLTMLTAAIAKRKVKKERRDVLVTGVLSAGGVVALWASYSRSAWVAALFSIAIVLVVANYKKLSPKTWAGLAAALLLIAGSVYIVRDSAFVSNVLLHKNPNGGSVSQSNAGHIESINSGLTQLIHQPFGAGVGSTGSASLLSSNPETIENQYLFIAHEVGWLGLALFMYISALVLTKLWRLRKDWLALGVFASGIGLAVIGLFLPVWVDDMVSIIWWGLAAIALCPVIKTNGINRL